MIFKSTSIVSESCNSGDRSIYRCVTFMESNVYKCAECVPGYRPRKDNEHNDICFCDISFVMYSCIIMY